MNKKDLAEKYAVDKYTRFVNCVHIIKDNRCFTFDDIKDAFNAGRESVVENIPDLEFKQTQKGGFVAENTVFCESYHLCCKATTGKWSFCMGYETPVEWYDTGEEAEQEANEAYKQRIKQALGL